MYIITPKNNNGRNRQRRSQSRRVPNNGNNDRVIGHMFHTGARGDVLEWMDDYQSQPITTTISQSPPRNLRNQIYWRTEGRMQSFTTSTSVPNAPTYNFVLSDIFDVASLAAIFDQFCIYAVKISITPNFASGASLSLGSLYSVLDFNDTTALTSSSDALSYGSCKQSVLMPGKTHERFIKPMIASTAYRTSALSSYTGSRTWVDIAYPSTPHFGLKLWIDSVVNSSTVLVYFEYILGFRQAK